jgi:hypothetical protein
MNALDLAKEKDFFRNLNEADIKRLTKKLKENLKDIRNGRLRKFFTSAEYVEDSDIFDFLQLQNKYFYERYTEGKEKAWKFLNNEDETIKAGWYDKKPQEAKLMLWADQAYFSANPDLWDVEFEQALLTYKTSGE